MLSQFYVACYVIVKQFYVAGWSSLAALRRLADQTTVRKLGFKNIAGWSSLAARVAHNHEVVGSNPTPATNHRT